MRKTVKKIPVSMYHVVVTTAFMGITVSLAADFTMEDHLRSFETYLTTLAYRSSSFLNAEFKPISSPLWPY